MHVRFIIDSASDILKTYADSHDMLFVPLTTTIDGAQYRDGVTLSHEDFYKKLEESASLPTTSQVTPYDFAQAYQKIRESGDSAVVITLSQKLSGTYQSAVVAAEGYADCVFVVDSENVTIGERILIEYAMRLRDAGMDAPGIAAELNRQKKRVCLVALLDTLEYLMRGGRISRTAALAGGLLNIKPVISVEDGAIVMLGKARGSRQSGNLLSETIKKKGGIDFDMPYMLAYSGLDDALLKGYIENSRPLWEDRADTLPVSTIGSTIGTHAGPGAIAVAFFAKGQA